MKTKHKRILFIAVLLGIVTVIVILSNQHQPFSGARQLPIIRTNNVEGITLEYYMGETQVLDCSNNQENLIQWFNNCKEVKTDVGTTSDCRITIALKDGGEIYIWNLYSEEWVTVGYRDNEHYYQSNVYSQELADFFFDFREEMEAKEVIDRSIQTLNI